MVNRDKLLAELGEGFARTLLPVILAVEAEAREAALEEAAEAVERGCSDPSAGIVVRALLSS